MPILGTPLHVALEARRNYVLERLGLALHHGVGAADYPGEPPGSGHPVLWSSSVGKPPTSEGFADHVVL